MKKTLVNLLIAALIVTSFTPFAYAETRVENPKGIIITQPGLAYTTVGDAVSILGASDWDFPLYMNGVEIDTTAHGFFAEYVSLVIGVNTFVFTNRESTETVTITRKPVTGTGTTTPEPFVASRYLYLPGSGSHYGVVTVNNATRARDNLEGKELMAPLAKNTKARIIGEDKYFYMLPDYSFVYKSGIQSFQGEMPANYVTGISVRDNQEFNSAEVSLTMNVNAYYNYTFDGNRMVLTLYGSQNAAPVALNDNKLVSRITPVWTNEPGACAFEIALDKGSLTNGVYVEFKDGKMIVGFKKVPDVSGGNLSNVKIFLDPGHGGTDPGAFGPMKTFGPVEKDINLEVARYTYAYLTSRGAEVITTRIGDTASSLADRMAIVTENKPDLSLSIHANAAAVTNDYNKAKGYRTYYTYELPVTGEEDAVAFLNRRVAELTGIPYNGKNKSNLALSRNQYCPSIIFEVAFMSNPADYEWLLLSANQKKVGEAIGQATVEWFETLNTMDAYDQNSIKVFANGKKLAFDVEPFIESGRTLVPIRRIFEALGATVTWNELEQTATVSKDGTTIRFKTNDNMADINGTSSIMDVPAKIASGGRTVVPLRFLSEALGYTVEWDGETRTITIN